MVLSMERWIDKVAIVTGASAGIGKAIAEKLVESGIKVVGIARRVNLVEKLADQLSTKKGKLFPLKCDVREEEDILKAFKWIKENLGPISILINNAGVIGGTNLIDGDTDIWKNIYNTNVMGLCICTREAVKDMKANNTLGHIIHINSISGHYIPYHPEINVYGSSKFAVTGLAETLKKELAVHKLKIKVTNISPAVVNTEIVAASRIDQTTTIGSVFQSMPMLEPQEVADAVIYALSTAPHVEVTQLTLQHIDDALSFQSSPTITSNKTNCSTKNY